MGDGKALGSSIMLCKEGMQAHGDDDNITNSTRMRMRALFTRSRNPSCPGPSMSQSVACRKADSTEVYLYEQYTGRNKSLTNRKQLLEISILTNCRGPSLRPVTTSRSANGWKRCP